MRWLFLAFVLVPLTELYLLLALAKIVGFVPTVTLVLVTGLLGAVLAKREGLRVFREWQAALARLEPPAEGVVEGVLVLLGGAFLITPGVLTDALGLFLLVPQTRALFARVVRERLRERFREGEVVRFVEVRGVRPRSAGTSGPETSDVVETTGEDVGPSFRSG